MQASACAYEQLPSYGDIIEQLMRKGLIEDAEPPLLRGDLWQKAKRRLAGCFPDVVDLADTLTDEGAVAQFRKVFDPIYVQLHDLAGMGVLCYENCITVIRKDFPLPKTPDFTAAVVRAARRTGTCSLAILTLRSIRIMTIAIDLGLISPVSQT